MDCRVFFGFGSVPVTVRCVGVVSMWGCRGRGAAPLAEGLRGAAESSDCRAAPQPYGRRLSRLSRPVGPRPLG